MRSAPHSSALVFVLVGVLVPGAHGQERPASAPVVRGAEIPLRAYRPQGELQINLAVSYTHLTLPTICSV